jgi:DNA polymerase (family 10)
MRNQEVAKLLYDIADILEIKGEMSFKIIAYRRAAQAIESMSKDVEDIAAQEKLDEIPGVGKDIAEKIEEYLEEGKSRYLESIRKGLPPGLVKLLMLEGIGPKKVKLFYEKLKIKTVEDLEKAAKEGKIRNIKGLGEKTELNILQSIEHSKKRGGRMLLEYALETAEEIVSEMKKNNAVEKIDVAGSIRRGRETIGDVDILVASESPANVIDAFTKIKKVSDVIAKGPTKASVHLINGLQVDLRVLPKKEYGSALMYFTGSKEHNVELRRIAIAKRMKLSEYGLTKGSKFIAGRTEEEVYKALDMQYIDPEIRENRGEVDLAMKNKLPKLIELKEIRGDLHVHTKWSDGIHTTEEMAKNAESLGYEYICITDHIGNLAIANAMNSKRVDQQRKEIDSLNKKLDIQILQGGEIDIRANGALDVENSVLKKLDIVFASLHSSLKSSNCTERIISAMENPNVDIIAHPTGRLIDKRAGAELDIGRILEAASQTGTLLEINAQPERLDLNDLGIREAVKSVVRMTIDTDAHAAEQMRFMRIGISTARRGWAKKEDIINAMPLEKMLKMLKK